MIQSKDTKLNRITNVCCQLLDLKDVVENMCEAVKMNDEFVELRKRVRYGEALMFSDYVKAIYPLLKDVALSPDINRLCNLRHKKKLKMSMVAQ
ncbi:hypothetical protein HID58_023648 [Brassica napus]|uniref:Uncharacterized protein n=1 Tax=Brassica napus TaxID=3708 RepID=A0ABQ8D2N4_BRANA|nr:hypothetical protein HID58_023648 [Brassica napus]